MIISRMIRAFWRARVSREQCFRNAPSQPRFHLAFAGFTIVEMLAVLAIFTFLTTMIISKYPDSAFKLKVENLTADLGGDFKESQLKASSVQSLNGTAGGYGLYFNASSTGQYKEFVDLISGGQSSNGFFLGNLLYDGKSEDYKTVTLAEGYSISDICVSATTIVRPFFACQSSKNITSLTVIYERPNPQPKIFADDSTTTNYVSACIEIMSNKMAGKPVAERTKGYVRNVIVTKSGLLSLSIGSCTQ